MSSDRSRLLAAAASEAAADCAGDPDRQDRMPLLIGCGERVELLPPVSAIGFKAHNLARMARLGLAVPPAFVIGTAWCRRRAALDAAVWEPALRALEQHAGLRFGDPRRPLLLSVRSGAPVSMPGMMETLLDIGLNDVTLHGLVRLTGNPRLAWDAYRRLIAGYGEIVLGVPAHDFEADLAAVADARDQRELDFAELRSIARRHLETVERVHGRPFPQDPQVQLATAIDAVFASWWSDKATTWRRINDVDDALGTAVTVQRMVFGNAGGASGAGVGFTRHPSTGEPTPWVDFLFNAQGEDVVSGRFSASGDSALRRVAPSAWEELLTVLPRLEAEFADMQDFEFTIEDGRLWMLQTRSGKRTPRAAARIALDLFDEGVIDRQLALDRTAELDETALTQSLIEAASGETPPAIAEAQSACTGVAVGEIALDEARVRARHAAGVDVLLLRDDAQTQDISALELAAGLLTTRGARTSHAAVVARQLGKVCLVGCDPLRIDMTHRTVQLGTATFAEGDVLTLDGNTGTVLCGRARLVHDVPTDTLGRLARLREAP